MARNIRGYPAEQLKAVPVDTVQNTLETLEELRKLPRCKTDEEVESRIDAYFKFCRKL